MKALSGQFKPEGVDELFLPKKVLFFPGATFLIVFVEIPTKFPGGLKVKIKVKVFKEGQNIIRTDRIKNISKKMLRNLLNKNRSHFPGINFAQIRKNSSNFLGQRTPRICCAIFARRTDFPGGPFSNFHQEHLRLSQENIPPGKNSYFA